jgi:hypothetical protein
VSATRDRRRLDAAILAIAADGALRLSSATTLARGRQLLEPIIEGDEQPAKRHRRENAEARAAMEVLGNKRGSALKVAKAMTKHCPHRTHAYAQRFRKLLRKKNAPNAFDAI